MTFSRRDLLKLGAGITASLAAGWRPSRLWAQESEIITKPIPSTGERVPVVGLGMRNYRIDVEGPELAEHVETIATFHREGGTVLDTSPNYGNSESVLGAILDELGIRDDLFIATKVDREDRRAGIERMEGSLERIGTDRVELMQVHNLRGADVQLPTIQEWKDRGRVEYAGVTTSSDRQYDDMRRIISRYDLDFIQVDYSLGNRNAADRILPMARDEGVAVLVNLPFGRGRLFQAVGDRSLPDWATEIGCDTWAQVFLKYAVSHPAVTVAIPGTTQPDHALDNMGAARGELPDAALRQRMEAFYDRL